MEQRSLFLWRHQIFKSYFFKWEKQVNNEIEKDWKKNKSYILRIVGKKNGNGNWIIKVFDMSWESFHVSDLNETSQSQHGQGVSLKSVAWNESRPISKIS